MTRDAPLSPSIKFLSAFRRNRTTNWFTKVHSRKDKNIKSRGSLHWIQISSPSTGKDRVGGVTNQISPLPYLPRQGEGMRTYEALQPLPSPSPSPRSTKFRAGTGTSEGI